MANITEITTAQEFESEVKSEKGAVLVDFWASWCGPCKMITPVVDKLAEEYAGKIKVVKVNVDEGGDLAGQMDVMGVPSRTIRASSVSRKRAAVLKNSINDTAKRANKRVGRRAQCLSIFIHKMKVGIW